MDCCWLQQTAQMEEREEAKAGMPSQPTNQAKEAA